MRAPASDLLLQAWESGLDQSPARRAVALLACTGSEPHEVLAALPVGARDARLFGLRRALFGETIGALAQCPACGERLDVSFCIDDVCPPQLPPASINQHELHACGHAIRYRLPNSMDLQSIPHDDPSPAHLLRRCVASAMRGETPVAPDALPPEVVAALGAAMAAADPLARIELALSCPGCGHAWDDLLDIGAFLWKEVDAWARRTLHDVHTLARAYGWSEAEILGMTPRRRDIYLDMVRL